MYSKLFKYDEKGNLIPLSIRESQIACVKEILRRDEGSPGDSDGRKKLYANKVISACCWIGDPKSQGNQQGYTDSALKDDAIRNCDLPDTWKPDKFARDLIVIISNHYKGGVAQDYVEGLLRTMRSVITTTTIISKRIEVSINAADSDDDLSDERLNTLAAMQTRLLNMAAAAPEHITALKQSVADLRVEEEEGEMALGNKSVDYSMKIHD